MLSGVFLALGGAAALNVSGQLPARDLNQIRSETSQRNQILDNPRNNPFNQNISVYRSNGRPGAGAIPGSAVRSYVLAAQRETLVTVLQIGDGDTLLVDDGAHKTVVRIIGIDAPERGQPFYEEAKKNLSDLLTGRKVILKYSLHNLKDETGFFPARVFLEDKDIGKSAVENGFAWRDPRDKFLFEKKDDETNRQAETKARLAKTGIWNGGKSPQKPWEYKKKLTKEKRKSAKK